MKGKRIFERFGFDITKGEAKRLKPAKLLSAFDEWEYNPKSCDWENTKTGELLTGFKLPTHLQALLENNINLDIK